MKDIYELLNDITIDENEFEEMEVNELEKAKVNKALKQSINKKKKMKSWKKNVAVASIIAGLSVTTFGIAFPTYANSLPVIGDIFRFLDNGRAGLYDDYKEYSNEMNITQESKGIKVTINDAIFDGKTVFLTYSLKSEQDLGEKPAILGNLDIKGSKGMTGSSQILKVNENNYVGLVKAANVGLNDKDTVKVKWGLDRILTDRQEEIKGDWNFALTLKATDSDVKLIGRSAEQDGVKVNIEKLSLTPMSFIVYYDQEVSKEIRNKWDEVEIDLKIKDDLGNSYSGEGNGGTGKDSYNMSWSKTFQKLDKNATKLFVTPHITLRNYSSSNHGGVELTENRENKISVSTPTKSSTGKDFVLDDIIIELN
ncbi:DUF4179 domain-containing protein [Aneurinibacillus tyrosinisolvens]|uniref:DUF4179 domain-containing protein n=1 Tax=Aneurinibacillus tyrosinisolvens TaxID=1443435 RepID=UPI00063F9AD4|nr:DUF4179 domain-containing protein [Aneurinibacillus tyrosinisolvens]